VGIANIIGWDDSVRDRDASYFAAQFYAALVANSTVITATAFAQREALRHKKLHWHLARCYLAPKGGGKLIALNKPRNPNRRRNNFHVMLDRVKKQVRVASKESFVGRRWQTKQALQCFSDQQSAGVLLYGIGGTGKSSLAAHIIDRLEPLYKAVIIYQHYDAFAILTALKHALKSNRNEDFEEWINKVEQDPKQLNDILMALLEDDFADTPIILLIDDLEQHILEPLQQGQQQVAVKSEFQPILAAIIDAFSLANSDSYLLLTSRYQFTLPNYYGDELADNLHPILVPDMSEVEQLKHWNALLQTDNRPLIQARDSTQDSHYLARIFQISQGNSGLQDILFTPLLKGETATLEQALQTLENDQADQPFDRSEQEELNQYLQRIALQAYSNALSDSEQQLLRILSLFDFPIPQAVILLAAPKLGLEQAELMLERLDNFGLLNYWQGKGLEEHISCFGLARKVVEPLSREDRNFIAKVCVDFLMQIWFQALYPELFDQYFIIKNTSVQRKNTSNIRSGELPLSELSLQQISQLHRFCIENSLVDWQELSFSSVEYIDLLELSISLNAFEKLMISVAGLKDQFTLFDRSELQRIFKEERAEWKPVAIEKPQSFLTALFSQFSARPDLLKQAYQVYFNDYNQFDMTILDNIDDNNQESHYMVAIKLAKTDSQKAKAFRNYADFLKEKKQDYQEAEVMYRRAVEADPNDANALGNFAKFLFVLGKYKHAKQRLQQAESQPDPATDLQIELAFYRYAHCEPYHLAPLKQLLRENARSPDWNLQDTIERALQDGHPQPKLLAAIAKVISEGEEIETLEPFEAWG
jgi:hypothetical protein